MHTLSGWYHRVRRDVRNRWIAGQIRRGIIPAGVELGEVYEALRQTKETAVLEIMGFLKCRVFRWGDLRADHGLVSAKSVTTAFANFLVDSFQDTETYLLDLFKYHDQGDDATAESNAHTALQNSRESRVSGSQTENGANRYKSVANITATANYTANEHGIFNASTSGVMLDRNLPANAPVLEVDDVVEWTYEILVNAES